MDDRPDRRHGWALFLLVAGVYLIGASGTLPSIDVQQSLEVAVNAVRDGTVEAERRLVGLGGGAVLGEDGRPFSAHNAGMPMLLLPVAALAGDDLSVVELYGVASLVGPVVGAAGVAAFWALQRRIGVGPRSAVVAALVYALATSVWPYAHDGFDVGPTNAAVVAALLALLGADDAGADPARRRVLLALAGTAVGAAVLLRVDALLIAPAFGLGALAVARRHRNPGDGLRSTVADGAAWVAPVVVAMAVTAGYNAVRFGSVFDTGHGGDPNTAFAGEVHVGLAGWLASPGKALLLFSPPLAVAAFGWRRLARGHPLAVAVAVGAVVPWLVVHAGLANWGGDEAFGPRFVVPVLGLLLLPLGGALDALRGRRVAAAAVGLVVALGVVVQLVGITVSAIPAARASETTFDAWAVEDSVLVTSTEALARAAAGDRPYAFGPDGEPPPSVDVWWLADDPVLTGPLRVALLGVFATATLAGAVGVARALRGPGRQLSPARR